MITAKQQLANRLFDLLHNRNYLTIADLIPLCGKSATGRQIRDAALADPRLEVAQDEGELIKDHQVSHKQPYTAATQVPNKVVITVTPTGYKTIVYGGPEERPVVLSCREMQRKSRTLTSGTRPGDVTEDLPDELALAEAVENQDLDAIMRELYYLKHGD